MSLELKEKDEQEEILTKREKYIKKGIKKQERTSNFELLRIVLILMVIALHYLNKRLGGALNTKNIPSGEFNYYLARIIESICIIAVNCFVLITGYFMHDKKKIKIGKVLELFFILIFYNTIIYILSIGFNGVEISKDTLNNFLNTFISGEPWFVFIYGILYLLIPYINIVIKNCNKKQMKSLIIILLFFFSIWSTFISKVTVNDKGYGIINFIILYLIGAYINKYKNENKKKRRTVNALAYIFFTVVIYICSIKFPEIAFNYNNIFVIISSIAFFLIFKDLKFKSKVINNLAKYTFGVYIIHINNFIRVIIWKKLLHTDEFYNSNYFALHLIASVVVIYTICIAIDCIRSKIFKLTIDKLAKKAKTYNYEISLD